MQLKKCLALALSLILFWACVKEEFESAPQSQGVVVGFYADGSAGTRTTINDDGVSTSWSTTDRLALWALNEGTQAYTLNNTPFKVYFRDTSTSAFFTTTLSEAMPEASYTYYATYPTPASVNGTTATFVAPATQDGKMGGGAAIMVATPQSGIGALDIITDRGENDELMDGNLHMSMNHKMHALRMFIPDIDTKRYYGFGDEKVERIELTMPWDIAGTVNADITDPAAGLTLTGNGSKTITLNLQEPIGATTASGNSYDYDYAYASIIPAPANDPSIYNGVLDAKIYTSTMAARATISFANIAESHQFLAGHITPVILNCSEVINRHVIRLTWGENYLGEDIHTIYFYDQSGNEVYRITDVASFVATGIHDIDYTFNENKDSILSPLAEQTLTVKYESANAIVSNTIVMPPNLATEAKCHEIEINVPYLFFEDFTNASVFNQNGDLSATGHSASTIEGSSYGLAGWTGNQIALIESNGLKALAIRHQSECSSAVGGSWQGTYRGRADSAPMTALKSGSAVKIQVSFTYTGYTNGSVAPQVIYGYTYDNSGAIAGQWSAGSSLIDGGTAIANISGNNNTVLDGGIADVAPNSTSTKGRSASFQIANCTNTYRLSWDCYAPYDANNTSFFGTNTQQWIFIDNIKVQIVSE